MRLGAATISGFAVVAIFGWCMVSLNKGLEPLGYGLLAWGGFIVLTPLTLVIHEMAHAAIAALLSRRVYQINIGSGAPFKSFRISHTLLIIGRDMGFGYVLQVPVETASRWGSGAILAAGATANFLAAALLMSVADHLSTWSGAAAAFVAGWTLSNVVTGVGALIPGRHIRDGQSRASDGRQILELFRRQRPNVDWQVHHDAFRGGELLQAKRWVVAETHYRDAFTRHPDQPGFLAVLLHVLAISKGYDVALACAEEHDEFLRQERQISEPMAPLWSYAWSMTAWSLIRSPMGSLTSAETFSQKAIKAAPNSPYAAAVQGALLTRSGEKAKGLAMILFNLKDLGSPSDKIEFFDFIIDEGLETETLRPADFRSYAAHLSSLA